MESDDHFRNRLNQKVDQKDRPDLLLWASLISVIVLYALGWYFSSHVTSADWISTLGISVFQLMNTIWWGIAIGVIMVAVLGKIPRAFVIAILGPGGKVSGVIRATLGGVLLDLCSHGILMVGAKLYERGASAGQMIAFLVASPWNSFSLTLILFALIGIKWTLAFLALSFVIAIVTGVLFDQLVAKGVFPANPNKITLPSNFRFWREARRGISNTRFDRAFFRSLIVDGLKESRMVLRWILFGVVLASLVRAFVDPDSFQTWFGPTLAGLGLTIIAATIIEVCSEGSAPIAADLLTRANAPGNSFAFLMTGVATDYTEIMVIRDTTRSWIFSLALPFLTVPQVVLIAWLMNLIGA